IRTLRVNGKEIPVIDVQCGAITEEVIEHCSQRGYIFATDPTSAWASTIGGNIAENAGGKKCVMWGTAIDNLLSFRIVNAKGRILEVSRRNHPYRKILPTDEVIFDVHDAKSGKLIKSVHLRGDEIRKKGLGKDITNKALGGVPGLQKEGGDGIIIDATFVLYKPFKFCRTICLEFFGNDMVNASRAIVQILKMFEKSEKVFLTALEHFDEKYVLAINYRNKSNRSEVPKAVLLIDLESNDEAALIASCESLVNSIKIFNTEGFIAHTDAMRETFWADRKNLGAIAKHTNAFKLNEDVVIPIERLPEFADFIEKLNVSKELNNYIAAIDLLEKYLTESSYENSDEFLLQKVHSILAKLQKVRENYTQYMTNLDVPAKDVLTSKKGIGNDDRSIFKLIQERIINISFNADVVDYYIQALKGYEVLVDKLNSIVAQELKRKIVVATHMHAGDGNVHVNIPVHSNDYLMMQEADETAGLVMSETVRLGGVISGEHGIGLTKLRFIDRETLEEYRRYKNEADPDDVFNPGKLMPDFQLSKVYTPSFNLLEMEAFILMASDLEKLSFMIAPCVRCGKCKSVCNTHYPAENIFYNPRNKILGVGLIVEAVLYDAQTSAELSFRHFNKLKEISDQCTICHKCQVPCPVKIDFGAVTLMMRELLVNRKKAEIKFLTALTLFYLKQKGYYVNKIFRLLFLRFGYSAQRLAYRALKPFSFFVRRVFPFVSNYISSKLPLAGKKTLREIIGIRASNTFVSFENKNIPIKASVLYFPGCGSERLFSNISMAAIALLYYAGVRVVIPPEYLCCGFPLLANGRVEEAHLKSYDNRVKFHKMANMIKYMGIEAVVVTCGTCREMLEQYDLENVFPNSKLMDVAEYLARKKLYEIKKTTGSILYHDPCHSPIKILKPETVIQTILGASVVSLPYCCGEGGTMALSTPELSNSLRLRKEIDIKSLRIKDKALLLTTCPSCVQGLSRLEGRVPMKVKSLVEYIAERHLGKEWRKNFLKEIKRDGFEGMML
ncbi:MAG: FAD-binding oxidoreductase, partial [Spirochaetes bacterium]|nr:FAD-binding oxidoreductase [Spirochaetota bacterium]